MRGRKRWERARRILLPLLIVSLVSLLVLELGLRLLLFGGGPVERWGARLRDAHLYANSGREDLYWQLLRRFGPQHAERTASTYDAHVGWTTESIEPGTYEHADEGQLGERRPVLLFGDSYAMCTVPAEDCFQGLMARSELADELCLMNYGVGGFGFDQTSLMVRAVLPRWRTRDPLVIVSVFVGDNLNRCALSFRQWPKPRYRLRGDELVLEPFEPLTAEEWTERHPPRTFSYLWRWFVFGSKLPPWELRAHWGGFREPPQEHKQLCAAIVRSLCEDLREQGVDAFFLVFPDHDDLLRPEPYRWEEELVVRELRALGFPFVNARRELREHLERTGARTGTLFEGGHYNARGNELAFEAIVRGIQGRFESAAGD